MNWKLILTLSLFGLAMAFATVFLITFVIEPAFWLLIFLFCAYQIAKRAPGQHFMHGLCLSLVNCIWISGVHLFLVKDYMANQPGMLKMYDTPFIANHPRLSMGIAGMIVGLVSGCILGLLSLIFFKLMNSSSNKLLN